MSEDLDTLLAAAWDDPPMPADRDPAFRIAVLQKLERRHYAGRMALVGALGVALMAAIFAFAGQLDAAAARLPANASVIAVIVVAVAATAWGVSRAFRVKLV